MNLKTDAGRRLVAALAEIGVRDPERGMVGAIEEEALALAPTAPAGLRSVVMDAVYELRNRKPNVTDADIADVLERAATPEPVR